MDTDAAADAGRIDLDWFAASKPAYMLAILGDARTRDELAARLNGITDSSAVYAAAHAIDLLSPDGSLDAAQKIEAIVRRDRFHPNHVRLIPVLEQFAARLRARAR